MWPALKKNIPRRLLQSTEQLRSQGLSSSLPLERQGKGRGEALGTRLNSEQRETTTFAGLTTT